MTRIRWSKQSLDDLEAIRSFIAQNSPRTADEYLERLIRAVSGLHRFPFSGGIVPEQNRQDLREIIHGNYRIIYHASDDEIEVLTVHHAARLLKGNPFT